MQRGLHAMATQVTRQLSNGTQTADVQFFLSKHSMRVTVSYAPALRAATAAPAAEAQSAEDSSIKGEQQCAGQTYPAQHHRYS
jgi:hypothetical protein